MNPLSGFTLRLSWVSLQKPLPGRLRYEASEAKSLSQNVTHSKKAFFLPQVTDHKMLESRQIVMKRGFKM